MNSKALHPRAAELIAALQLAPHPEGGRFRRMYTSPTQIVCNGATRPAITAINYLLTTGEFSRWHRVDADELWQHNEGDAVELLMFDVAANKLHRRCIGRFDEEARTTPLIGVPARCWQAARLLGDYALVQCTVAPGFDFAGFALLDEAPEIAATLAGIDPALLELR